MKEYPLIQHKTVRAMARFSGNWPRILRPGDVFAGYITIPTCLAVRETGLAYAPVIGREGELVGLIEFHARSIEKPIGQIVSLLQQGSIIEVQASYQFLCSRPALLADAGAMLSAASALAGFFKLFPGETIDVRHIDNLRSDNN